MDDSVDLKHYNVEMEPQAVTANIDKTEQLGQTTALDGNSQLFLALEDMSNEKFINKFNAATNDKPVKVGVGSDFQFKRNIKMVAKILKLVR